MTSLTDRAQGLLVAQACGDALGVPYEFGPPLPEYVVPRMLGGGPAERAPGEYSDDTAMSVCVAEALRDHPGDEDRALDAAARAFVDWVGTAPDAGRQTRRVLDNAAAPTAAAVHEAAQAVWRAEPEAAGNGALMRTSVIALSRPSDRRTVARLARRFAELTHPHPDCVESCVLWTEAVRRALTGGALDVLSGLDLIDDGRRRIWRDRLDAATGADSRQFAPNGYTVTALQAAWAAISSAPGGGAVQLTIALMAAVRGGHDTDTVAAIAGGLVGARWGASAVPREWSRLLHGYGGYDAEGLGRLATSVLP